MRLTTAAASGEALTEALPVPYPVLHKAGLRLLPGQTSLWVAAPGVGKSQLLSNIAQRMHGVPVVYWSADTDSHDVLVRSMAMWSGSTTEEVERQRPEKAWADHYLQKISAGRHVEWIFDPSITEKHLHERLLAFMEVHGEFPRLVVIDNLSNTVQHVGDEFAEQKQVLVAMQRLARESGAHIAVLAHAKGEYDNGMKPIPQNGVLNNLSKIPEVIVTLYRWDDDGKVLGVVVAKNRGGRADPGAKHPVQLQVDYSRASVLGFEAAA